MAYVLIQEGRTTEGRAEIDELLAGPKVADRRERAEMIARLGGEMRGGRK